jgi:hypothetical protein
MLDVTPDPPGDCKYEHDSYYKIEAMEPGLESIVLVPLLAQLLANVRETETPWQ